jgi:hypothetical protein
VCATPVIGSELSQRLSLRPPTHQFTIRGEATQPLPVGRAGDWGGGSVVSERPHQDYWVDQAEHVLAGAQAGCLNEGTEA